jgi:hypothetical protein
MVTTEPFVASQYFTKINWGDGQKSRGLFWSRIRESNLDLFRLKRRKKQGLIKQIVKLIDVLHFNFS